MVFILPMQLVVRVVDSRRYIWLLPDGTLQFLVWESNLIHLANHHYVLDYIRRKSYIYNWGAITLGYALDCLFFFQKKKKNISSLRIRARKLLTS